MHSNIILAALLAGSQIAAAAVARPARRDMWSMPDHGGGWSGSHWGWGSYGPQSWGQRKGSHVGTQQTKSGYGQKRKGNGKGYIGKHRKQDGDQADGFIGKHRGHSRPKSGSDNAGYGPSVRAPSQQPNRTKKSSGYGGQPTSHAKPSSGHHKPPSGYGNAPSGSSYQEQVLHYHNVHRANHSAPALTWSQDLANTAETIANSCKFEHNLSPGGGGYGQNIAAGTPPNQVGKVISDQFYNGEEADFNGLYGVANPTGNFEQWGHFTQLVWKATSQVGCATVHCAGGVAEAGSNVPPYFTVCNYKSPGNVAGQYARNVGKPLGHPPVVA